MNKLDKDIIEKLAYRVAELGGRAEPFVMRL